MWNELIIEATKNGLWALLFVSLLIFILKDSKMREKNYQKTVDKLSDRLEIVNDIKEQLKSLCDAVKNISRYENKIEITPKQKKRKTAKKQIEQAIETFEEFHKTNENQIYIDEIIEQKEAEL